MAAPQFNMVTTFIWWVIFLPIRVTAVVVAGYITLLLYYISKIETLGGREASILYLRQNVILPELKNEMPKVLSPAQYDYAYNHLVTYITDILSETVDTVFVTFGVDPSILQLATLVAMSASFRLSASLFIYATAALLFVSGLVYGRYKFHLEWKKSKVVEVSSTKFAIGWQSKVVLPMLLFVYMASPVPLYQAYAITLSLWSAFVGYTLSRSFTDHL